MTPEQFEQFRRKVVAECGPDIARCIIPIYGLQDGMLKQNGTGILLEIGDKQFLISAAHVFDVGGIHGFPYCTAPCEKEAKPIPLVGIKVYTSPIPKGRDKLDPNMRDDDPWDIGVGVLPAELAEKLRATWRFARLLEFDMLSQPTIGIYYVFGWPCVWTPEKSSGLVESEPLRYVTELFTGKPDDRDAKADILLEYPEENKDASGNKLTAPLPNGISGCGIWRLAEVSKPLDFWKKSDYRLVGIEHRWRSSKRYLRGTWIKHAVRLIYNHHPELHPAMDLAYGRTGLQWHFEWGSIN